MSASTLLLLLSSLLPGQVSAEEPAPSALEALVSRLEVEGGVDVYYGYNFNRPEDSANFLPGTGTTAKRHNEFSLNLASLGVRMAPEPVGLDVVLGFGTSVEVLHAGEPEGVAVGPGVWRFLQVASLSWRRGPLLLEAGIFPSHIGLESLQSQLNWTYTRGWMGELSPYYQTGLKGTWRFSDAWSAQLHLLNGWQTIGENNRGKALGTQVAYAGERLSAAFNTFLGEENSEDGAGLRLFGDLVATYRVTETLSVAGTMDVGLQRRPGLEEALWYGAALNARVQLAPSVAVAGRAELYNDVDGLITGTAQRLVSGTLTLEVKPAEYLILKLEARYDLSTEEVFDARPAQTLVVAGATAYF